MSLNWTEEEKKVAQKLSNTIRDEIEKNCDQAVENAVKKIVKLSKEGLDEEAITKKICEGEGPPITRSLSGALALARMEGCMAKDE